MEIPVIYVFTHDSIGVGEDGPTHQPIEHLASLRAIPGLIVIRPADANEVVEAWKVIMQLQHQPAVLILTRQDVPTLDRTKYAPASGLAKGAYVLADAAGRQARRAPDGHRQRGRALRRGLRAAHGRGHQGPRRQHAVAGSCSRTRTQAYRDQVLPPDVTARVSVEQASTFGWAKYVGRHGADHRHAHLRRLGPAQGPPEGIRLHRGASRRGREGAVEAGDEMMCGGDEETFS